MPGWSSIVRWLLGRPAATNRLSVPFLELDESYEPPVWAKHLDLMPEHRRGLAMLPTPVHQWHLPGLPPGVEVWIKRDDLTGMQLSGNKVRKLEFLLAAAQQEGCDCVVTIGGVQSNHCRATAVAAKYLGLDCHLMLRTSRQLADSDPGLVGNLLVDRMVGATLHMVTKEEYARHGSAALGQALVQQLQAQGRKPFLIPVGGSNALGTWGYLQAVEEMRQQISHLGITDIAMACGSGGTTAGLALGVHLAGLRCKVHAYGVCDDPDYFYNYIDALLEDLGVGSSHQHEGSGAGGAGGGGGAAGGVAARGLLRAVQARGVGYAMSTEEELQTVADVAQATGIVLDPVYSGKAVHALLQEVKAQPEAWQGRRILFVHTGGLLGMYDKVQQLQEVVAGADTNTTATTGATSSSSSSSALLANGQEAAGMIGSSQQQQQQPAAAATHHHNQRQGRVRRFVM